MSTHTPTAQGHSFLACFPVMHIQCPCHYTHMHTCTPTCRESYSFHACTPAHSCQGWGRAWAVIPAPDTTPQSIPTSSLRPPCRDNCHRRLHVREYTHMYPHQKWGANSACYACTPPTVRCVSVQGVSCTLSGLSGFLSPTLTAIIHNVLEMPVPSPQLTSIFMYVCVCVRVRVSS